MTTGISNGEAYELARTKTGTRLIVRRQSDGSGNRGRELALALRARPAHPYYYLTPVRAEKWRALFMAGFSARRKRVLGINAWAFVRGGQEMDLRTAVKLSQNEPI